uniref:Ovule protein n=1 Tax=Parascaris equorum TaxID=6256 RepID=A0A914S1I8_PAREQ
MNSIMSTVRKHLNEIPNMLLLKKRYVSFHLFFSHSLLTPYFNDTMLNVSEPFLGFFSAIFSFELWKPLRIDLS